MVLEWVFFVKLAAANIILLFVGIDYAQNNTNLSSESAMWFQEEKCPNMSDVSSTCDRVLFDESFSSIVTQVS